MNIIKMIKDRNNRINVYNKSDYWDDKAKTQDGNSVSMWPNNNLNHLIRIDTTKELQPLFNKLEGKTILDAGCGFGYMSSIFAEKGAKQVIGSDFSSKVINIAKKNNKYNNITFIAQNIYDLNDINKYDYIFTWGVLCLACSNKDDLLKVFSKMYDSLSPKGEIVLIEPIHDNFLYRVLKIDVHKYISIIESSGFKITYTSQITNVISRLLLAHISFPAWITNPIYKAGNFFMRNKKMKGGDYKVIYAKKI